ncbi:MAG: ABC transporter ATP-binding protein [Bacilli bacterium]
MVKIFKYVLPLWKRLILISFGFAAMAFLQLQIPRNVGLITNLVLADEPTSEILMTGLWMLLLSLGVIALAIGNALLNSSIATGFAMNVRNAVFQKVNQLSLSEFEKFGTSSLITRTTNDVQQIQGIFLFGLRILITTPVTLVTAITLTLGTNPLLVFVFAVSVPIIFIAIAITFKIASPLFEKVQKKIDQLTLVLRENLTGVRVVRAFNQEVKEAKRFANANEDLTQTNMHVSRTMSYLNPFVSLIFDLTYLSIFFVGFASFDGQNLNLTGVNVAFGDILSTAQYSSTLMFSLLMFAAILIMLPRARASAKRINEVLDTHSSIVDPKQPVAFQTTSGKVEFKNVVFQFKDSQQPTLKNISFVAEPKKVTAIIGSTGSGKSSIINLIPRFFDVTHGQVLIDEVDVRNMKQADLRSKIGFVPQQALLFTGTVKHNLTFGKPNASDEEVWQALEVAQADHFIKKYPEQLNVQVSQTGKNFSGGQKQRLAIARALVKKPEIYVFDDAFSALDYKTDIRLRNRLKTYTNSATVIIVAQRVSTIIDADHIVVLHEGQIVGQGKHQALLKSCEIYKEIVYSQLDPEEVEKTLALTKNDMSLEGSQT